MKNLKPAHPRLLFSTRDWDEIRARCQADSRSRAWHEQLLKKAVKLASEPPVEHKLEGPRLLSQSRKALDRISLLAGLYRIDGKREFAERARKEMRAAAAFTDWNPSHFLDTAEMTAALAIGYDWLFDVLSAEDRATVRKAIIEKGLRQGRQAMEKGIWWAKSAHNWNQVCHGGMTLGALAIAEDEPELAARVVELSLAGVPRAMASFAPDGGWGEGPSYWSYATRYNVYFIAALESALGADFGLKALAGFADAGFFRMHSSGPTGKSFNFADAPAGVGKAAQMFWFARAFQRPVYAAHELSVAGAQAEHWHLFWGPGAAKAEDLSATPTAALFRGIHLAFFRSAWNDPRAVYIGFKGGDNKTNHSHLDLGTFVLDAAGQRWAEDLGGDNYNLPEYFGGKRWTYYRLRTEGHNTLTLDGANQDIKATAPIVGFLASRERAFAVADLSAAYRPKARTVLRGVALLGGKDVLVQDEFELGAPAEALWQMHTRAKVEIQGDRALLSAGGAQLEARVLGPKGARFEAISANPPPPQGQQPDVTKLVVRCKQATKERIVVLLRVPDNAAATPSVEPLGNWIAAGKVP